jgi:hypothetical protein
MYFDFKIINKLYDKYNEIIANKINE